MGWIQVAVVCVVLFSYATAYTYYDIPQSDLTVIHAAFREEMKNLEEGLLPSRNKRAVPALLAALPIKTIITKAIGTNLLSKVGSILGGAQGQNMTNDFITGIIGKLTDEILNTNKQDEIDKELTEYFKQWEESSDANAAEARKQLKEAVDGLVSKNNALLESKVKLNIIPQKGFNYDGMFSPPGYKISTEYKTTKSEPDSQMIDAYAYDKGVGSVLLNGCYAPSFTVDDPCYAAKRLLPKCDKMLDSARFIGVGFDGRGEYNSRSRKKSIIQRICMRGGSYDGRSVPDSMTVHGVYDTDVRAMSFQSVSQYQHYLEKKAAVSQSNYMFVDSVTKAYGKASAGFLGLVGGGGGFSVHGEVHASGSSSSSSSSHSVSQQDSYRELFMSTLEVDVIRYEIFLDDVTFNDLNMDFIHGLVMLPTSYYAPGAPKKLQAFILQWGTHYIKSAVFGGQLRLYKTKTASRDESIEQFATKAQSDYKAMFSTYLAASAQFKSSSIFHSAEGGAETSVSAGGGTAGASETETQESTKQGQQQKYSNEVLEVQGGDQGIAAVVSEMYTTGFKDELKEWLESIPTYPKPFEFQMAPITDLCNINYKQLFPNASLDFGCFGGETLLTEPETGRRYYVWATLQTDGNTTTTNEQRRYCDFENQDDLQYFMQRRCSALRRAMSVYFEEGPIPSSDITIPRGRRGCQTMRLSMDDRRANLRTPVWDKLTDGSEFKVIFDMEVDIESYIDQDEVFILSYSSTRNKWYARSGDSLVHLYDGWGNGGSNSPNNKKMSIRGMILLYDEPSGLLRFLASDFNETKAIMYNLPDELRGKIVARVEYLSMMHQIQEHRNEFGVGSIPCNVVWSNAHRINPAIIGGRCIAFTAVSRGDIFVIFAAIPRDRDTWYYVQIGPKGVAIYKGTRVMKFADHLSARSLGDYRLFESYFVCIEEDFRVGGRKKRDATEMGKTKIMYGKMADRMEQGIVHLVLEDYNEPLNIRFYAFGNGDHEVNIMDAHVLRAKATGEHVCVGGAMMFEGSCTENCHEECLGCHSPNSDEHCRECRHYRHGDRCVAECPDAYKPDASNTTCICVYLENDECVSSCSNDRIAVPVESGSDECICQFYLEGAEDICLAHCPLDTYEQLDPSTGVIKCRLCHAVCKPQPDDVRVCTAASTCTECYNQSASSTLCVVCLGPRYLDFTNVETNGRPVCRWCEAGYRCPGDGRRYECSVESNEYSPAMSTICEKCAGQKHSTIPASGTCHSCPSGYYMKAGSTICRLCPGMGAGPNCQLTCNCPNGRCLKKSGQCSCYYGFKGARCQIATEGACRLADDRFKMIYYTAVAKLDTKPVPTDKVYQASLLDIAGVPKTVIRKTPLLPVKPPLRIISKGKRAAARATKKLATNVEPVRVAVKVDAVPAPAPAPALVRSLNLKLDTPDAGTQEKQPQYVDPTKTRLTNNDPTYDVKKINTDILKNLNVNVLKMSGRKSGRVEIFHDGQWGTICDVAWTNENSQTVCKQFGYNHGAKISGMNPGKGQIWLTHVQCRGGESRLNRCSHTRWGANSGNCRHSDDVAVACW